VLSSSEKLNAEKVVHRSLFTAQLKILVGDLEMEWKFNLTWHKVWCCWWHWSASGWLQTQSSFSL